MNYRYYDCCVNWPAADVDGGLCAMVDSGRTVRRATFIRNVGASLLSEFERLMRYPMGKLTMARDYAVQYYRGKLHGRRVYWVNHSAIEYVFVPDDFREVQP